MDQKSDDIALQAGLKISRVLPADLQLAYWFRVYELFVIELEKWDIQHLIARELVSQSIVCVDDENGIPISAAVVWHIIDPYDIKEGQRPDQDPEGRWAYVPLMVTSSDHRSIRTVRSMIENIKKLCPKAKRIGFKRFDYKRKTSRKFKKYKRDNKRLHVINL